MIYCICLKTFLLDLKTLGWSPILSLYEHHFPVYHHHLLRLAASSPPPPSPPHPFPRLPLPLCKQNSEPCLFMLLLGLAAFSVGGRVPLRGQWTDEAYIMISKSVVSAALILASLHTSPCGGLVLPSQVLLCRGEPESPRHVAPSHHW